MSTKHNPKYVLHKDYPFWCNDPEGDGLVFFRTEAERDSYAKDVIRYYLDGGEWREAVSTVCAGVLTHIATRTNVEKRPDNLDEDGCDDEGLYWEDHVEYRCDYELKPIGGEGEQ